MAAVGPLLGGWLTENHSWRWAFYINVPIAIIIVIGSLLVVRESRDEQIAPGLRRRRRGPLRARASVLFVFAPHRGPQLRLGRTTAATSPGRRGSASRRARSRRCSRVRRSRSSASAALLRASSSRRTRAGKVALLDFATLPHRHVRLRQPRRAHRQPRRVRHPVLAAAVPAERARATRRSRPARCSPPSRSASFLAGPTAARLAEPALTSASSPASAWRLEVRRDPRARVQLSTPRRQRGGSSAFWLVVYGVGVGYASAQLTGLILADVPSRQSGQASGTQSTARQIGSALGTAVLGTILFVALASLHLEQPRLGPGARRRAAPADRRRGRSRAPAP